MNNEIVTTPKEDIEQYTYESYRRIHEARKKIIEVYHQLNKFDAQLDNIWQKMEKASIKSLINDNKDK